jgi:hypothetical protein
MCHWPTDEHSIKSLRETHVRDDLADGEAQNRLEQPNISKSKLH